MRIWIIAIGLAAVVGTGLAQDEEEIYGPRPMREAQVRERDADARKKYAGDEDKLVLPGLVAHRKERRVEVLVESTGLAGEELIEFLLVDKDSSHGYEALLWSHAKPSDVHQALVFIGLKPGKPFNPHVLRFWSDGDRVRLSVMPEEGGGLVPIEQLATHTDTKETLPEEGFVFAGSIKVPAPDKSGAEAYAADIYDPRSVASLYSEPSAVLDVPRQVIKEEAYGKLVVNGEAALKHGTLLTLVIEPMDAPGTATQPTAVTLAMDLDATGSNYTYRLTGDGKKVLNTSTTLVAVLETLVGLRKQDVPAALTVTFAANLPIAEVRKTCVPLMMLENMGSIQVEAPAPEHLYYRAYVPDPAWARPDGRPSQPWELRLTRSAEGAVTGALVLNEAVWGEGSFEPVSFTRRQIEVASPEAMRLALAEDAKAREVAGKSPLPPALLVFVPPTLTYAQLHDFIASMISKERAIHVFVEN